MRQYLKEMDITDVEEFTNSEEFERTYFLSLVPKATEKKEKTKPFEGLSQDHVKYLNGCTWAEEKTFAEKIQIVLHAESGHIVKVNTAKVFDHTVTELVAKNCGLEALVADPFKDQLTKLLETMAQENEARDKLAIKNDKDEIWLVSIHAQLSGKSIIVTIKDLTLDALETLGRVKPKTNLDEAPNLKPVDLIIFRYNDILEADYKKWVTKAAALLKKLSLWPSEFRPKFVALRYDDDSTEKHNFQHVFIDDLISLPMDRLVFLQKIEIALKLPKKISPSYLYVQESQDNIEVSKRVSIDRINESYFAITNPVPLRPGTGGHFYFRFPGQKNLLDIYGKVSRSAAHPEIENAYLVYFQYFGISREMVREIRQYFNRDPHFKLYVDSDTEHFKYNPDNIFLAEEQKQKKTIAVLDFDETSVKSVIENLRADLGNIDVVHDSTYYGFFKRYLDAKNNTDKSTPAKSSDLFTDNVCILVSYASMDLQMPLTPPGEEDKILGHLASELFAQPQGWLKLFSNNDSKNFLMECLNLVQTSMRLQKNINLSTDTGELRTATIEFICEDNPDNIRINIKPLEHRAASFSHLDRIESLDAVIMDTSLLPEDVDNFIANLTQRAQEAGLRVPADGVQVVALSADFKKIKFNKLLDSKLNALVAKPIEARRMLTAVTDAIKTPYSINTFPNLRFKDEKLLAKLAKATELTEISEFGAVFKSDAPIKPGTLLYFFQSIFKNAPDQNLCVRVYHCEEATEEDKKYFLISVIYFGISDTFLKYTRAYIRETYASKKSKESTGGN